MFLQRAIVTLTLAPLGILLIYLGGLFYFIPVVILIMIATLEYANFMRHLGWKSPGWLMLPWVLLLLVDAQWPQLGLLYVTLTAALFAVLIYGLWRYERNLSQLATADWLATMGGIVFIGWMGSHLLRVRGLDESGQWAILAIMIVWMADTFAYLVGRQYGRHKLVPRLSPKKSVEGYVAGIVMGTIGSLVLAYFFLPEVSIMSSLIIALIITAVAPAGDLGISLLKREAGVKDSGHLFPGHGGALDRLDALLVGVPLAYYLILLLR